jgi:hypothetical protein
MMADRLESFGTLIRECGIDASEFLDWARSMTRHNGDAQMLLGFRTIPYYLPLAVRQSFADRFHIGIGDGVVDNEIKS